MAPRLHHLAVFVTDMDRASHLFLDVLGWKCLWRAEAVSLRGLAEGLGVPDSPVDLAYLAGTPHQSALELIRIRDREANATRRIRYGEAGSGHLSVVVEDIDEMYRRLAAEGWPPLTSIIAACTGGGEGVRLFFFRTEDALTVEIIDACGADTAARPDA